VKPDERYWIAINGASCALTGLPLAEPKVTPTPEQLIGFPTLQEAREAQRCCLQESMGEVRRFLGSLRPDVRSGRIRVIQPPHPQPPTSGPTMWTDSAEVHAVVQRLGAQ
jgi:hypothetical protein